MKSLLPIALALATTLTSPFSGAAVAEQTASDGSVVIEFTGIEPQDGRLYIALFADEAAWRSNDAVDGKIVEVEGETATVRFEALTAGAYGLKVFHDVNGNGELDVNGFGIPREPYAFSNNAPVRFGPPSWAAAAFTVDGGGAVQAIRF